MAEKLPELVASEFQKPDSPVRVTVANQVETIISTRSSPARLAAAPARSRSRTRRTSLSIPIRSSRTFLKIRTNPSRRLWARPKFYLRRMARAVWIFHSLSQFPDFFVTNDGTDTAKAVQLQVAKDSRFENIVLIPARLRPQGRSPSLPACRSTKWFTFAPAT